jgi:hypothetical protein
MQTINSLSLQNLFNFNYSYTRDLIPRYNIGDYKCNKVVLGKGRINSTLIGDQLQNFISTSGNSASLSFSLSDICGNSLNGIRYSGYDTTGTSSDTTYTLSGFIESFDVEMNSSDIIKGTIGLIQYL